MPPPAGPYLRALRLNPAARPGVTDRQDRKAIPPDEAI